MKLKIDSRSLLLGVLFGIIITFLIGFVVLQSSLKEISSKYFLVPGAIPKTATQKTLNEISGISFLVLGVIPKEDSVNSSQTLVLRLSPHYGKIGKISKDGFNFRMKNETQELSLVVHTPHGYKIQRGDLIGFRANSHWRSSPGEHIVRHLPSGGAELVP